MKTNALHVVTIFCTIMFSCNSPQKEKQQVKLYEPTKSIAEDPVKRGEHLVNAIGCHDCHTPKKFSEKGMELNMDRLLSGHPASEALGNYDAETAKSYILFTMGLTASIGPWGTSFAANLTPDDTGIGAWSESQFLNAIKNGKYKGLEGSRPLSPPMPWESYRNLPDDDLKAIFTYLKTLKPVENLVPTYIPPQVK
jgi:hypothetical protein